MQGGEQLGQAGFDPLPRVGVVTTQNRPGEHGVDGDGSDVGGRKNGGVARGVRVEPAAVGDQGAVALQHQHDAERLGERHGPPGAILLHGRRVRPEQAGELAGVRRQYRRGGALPEGGRRVAERVETVGVEDERLAGAGAVKAGLPGARSPEAEAACEAFRGAGADLLARLRACSSGRELIERGFASDVELAKVTFLRHS